MLSVTTAESKQHVAASGQKGNDRAALALRKGVTGGSNDRAAQFVPLLNWEEDRVASVPLLPNLPHRSNSAHDNKAVRTVNRSNSDSDASISSSSDEEFQPAGRRVRRLAAATSARKCLELKRGHLAVQSRDVLFSITVKRM